MPPKRDVILFPEHDKFQIPTFPRLGALQRFLIRIKSWVFAKQPKIYHLHQERQPIWETASPPSICPASQEVEYYTLPIYSGIGVGVYQGHHVILRQLAKDYFSQDWVVERLQSYNLCHVPKKQSFQLHQLAVLLLLLQQSDHSESDLRILDEIELETDCPYFTQLNNSEFLSEVVCDSEVCPIQKLVRIVSKQAITILTMST